MKNNYALIKSEKIWRIYTCNGAPQGYFLEHEKRKPKRSQKVLAAVLELTIYIILHNISTHKRGEKPLFFIQFFIYFFVHNLFTFSHSKKSSFLKIKIFCFIFSFSLFFFYFISFLFCPRFYILLYSFIFAHRTPQNATESL